ncbi:MAG: hypothetical protein GQ532_13385 [Methylomarinum sp.]|nr:hypothetical protein [Methylomarinum sp.]
MANNTDYIDATNDVDLILKLALKTINGINMLLMECKSDTVKILIQSNIANTTELWRRTTLVADEFEKLGLINGEKERGLLEKYSKSKEEFDTLSKKYKTTKQPSLQLKMSVLYTNMEDIHKEIENVGVSRSKKLDVFIEINSEVKKTFERFHSSALELVALNQVYKMAAIEIAKELDFSFILKGKAIVDKLKYESDKVILCFLEADSVFLKWELFNKQIVGINKKLELLHNALSEA